MSIERYLLTSFMIDAAILGAAARACGAFRAGRIAGLAGVCALYGALAAARPFPWSTLPVQAGLLIPVSAAICGEKRAERVMLAGLTAFGGVVAAAGTSVLLGGGLVSPMLGACLFALLMGSRARLVTEWNVRLGMRFGARTTRFRAFIDTGNRLREPISGLPVLIVESRLLCGITPDDGGRSVAYGALGGGGVLRCFRPDAMWIETARGPRRAPAVYVAPYPGRLPGPASALAPGEFAAFTSFSRTP